MKLPLVLARFGTRLAAAASYLRRNAPRYEAVRERLNFGIAARLITAFVGVGVLVVVANFFVVKSVLVQTTEVRAAPPAAPPPAPKPVELPAPAADVVTVPPPPRRALTSEALTMAVDRLDRAAKDRAGDNTDETQEEYVAASAKLDEASRAFISEASAISGKPFAKLGSALKSYGDVGDALVKAADQRHDGLAQYSALFEQIYARANGSVQSAWKVFGRVVARQSLLQLSTDLDELRRQSAVLESADAPDAPVLAPLLAAERAIIDNLQSNEKGFRRSEGDAWYTAMTDDLTRLVALRESVVQSNVRVRMRGAELAQATQSIAATIPAKVESPLVSAVPKAVLKKERKQRTASAPPVAPPAAAAEPVTLVPAAPVVQTSSITRDSPQDKQKRALVAWTSGGVLLLMCFIAFGTVLSVVRPVRRLHHATLRLAKGDTSARVQRGGIPELDTLAIAFNSMAEELAAAKAATRNYQEDLEAKVAQRTQQLKDMAERDPLTGLPNRRELFALLNAAIAQARAQACLVGVFFLDIDNFKYINDGMGHAFGDCVLVSLAERLQEAARGYGFAARLGGDEFTVVFAQAASLEDIRRAGLGVVQAFQKPLSVQGRDLIVSVSVGASVFPDHEQEPEALLRAADAALFRAKALGRSQLSLFTRELVEVAAAKFTTEQGLRRAVERGEFELAFQPELDAETMEVALVEALIRWRMPDGSLASPGQFLAVAEESGLIMEISDWVLRSAIEAAAHWHHGEWPEARVAINVSSRQLLDNSFSECICELLREFNLPARCIEIELTESVLQTGPATIEALRYLRAQGVAIALDDFGTGYSSLASVEQLPLSRIKLDRSLIAGVDTSARSAAIARAIIGMCQGLGLQITAEGVERPEQFAMLTGYPGMYLQGFLFSPPVARQQVTAARYEVQQRAHSLLLEMKAQRPRNLVELPLTEVRRLPETG